MLATLAREGLVSSTPIQEMSIPLLLEGRDLIGLAQTGTGKNRCIFAAFNDASWLQRGRSSRPAAKSIDPCANARIGKPD